MKDRILVTFASRKGGTTGIAEKIGEELQATGLQVDVIRVDRMKDLSHTGLSFWAVRYTSEVGVKRQPIS